MSVAAARGGVLRLPGRLVRLASDLVVGTVLCLNPVTSIIALGWLTRLMRATVAGRWGDEPARPGWILGARGGGWVGRALGGLAENIRAGVVTALGLLVLTAPFTAAWLGAWWAGWENSFNKGYEQAAVGPIVWLIASIGAAYVLVHLPFALAHAAYERRFGAFFELRRLRSVAAAAGWRAAWLSLLSVAAAVPLFGMQALPVFVEGIVPGFADMTAEEQAQVGSAFGLAAAALSFTVLLFLRHRAAAIYARAVPRAATGRHAALWAGHPGAAQGASGAGPSRIGAMVWLGLAMALWAALPILIVAGQFMNYDPLLWITHPLYLLPWPG